MTRVSKIASFGAALLTAVSAFVPEAKAAANFVIVNNDEGTGAGFDDPTPRVPVGGNPGTTLGAQRLNALHYVTDVLWGALLDSDVDIVVAATFRAALECDASGAVLGSAAPAAAYDLGDRILYPSALADRLAGYDIGPSLKATSTDIVVNFNGDIDAGCLPGTSWYYGLDGNAQTQLDLVAVLMHEIAHGLGFSVLSDLTTGALLFNKPSIYETFLFDLEERESWDQMNRRERRTSATTVRNLVWNGPVTMAGAARHLAYGLPSLSVPGLPLSGLVGEADWGPTVAETEVSAALAVASPVDACSPLQNDVSGKLVVADRGNCAFLTKTEQAQAAGAQGLIIVDSTDMRPPRPMAAETAWSAITIPTVRVTLSDGMLLKESAGTTATLSADATRLVGADPLHRPYMNAVDPLELGSSISHWDELARPNLLMEPILTSGLPHDPDLTFELLVDLGWAPVDCGNEIVDENEACDDGNTQAGDGCNAICELEACGDGTKNNGQAEECDDGNTLPGDGCDATCQIECFSDADDDGVLNCDESCPRDPNKTLPGACGCGKPDVDSDSDGTLDCDDGCASDPSKQAPGLCGCNAEETDSDGDSAPDCIDACPDLVGAPSDGCPAPIDSGLSDAGANGLGGHGPTDAGQAGGFSDGALSDGSSSDGALSDAASDAALLDAAGRAVRSPTGSAEGCACQLPGNASGGGHGRGPSALAFLSFALLGLRRHRRTGGHTDARRDQCSA